MSSAEPPAKRRRVNFAIENTEPRISTKPEPLALSKSGQRKGPLLFGKINDKANNDANSTSILSGLCEIEIRWLPVSNEICEGGFWLQHSVAAPFGGLFINRCDKRKILEARTDAHEFLAACGRLRCTIDPYRLSRLLGGGHRTSAWCAAMLRVLRVTTERHFQSHRKYMYRGTLLENHLEELRQVISFEDDEIMSKKEPVVINGNAADISESLEIAVAEEAPKRKAPMRRESIVGMLDFDTDSDDDEDDEPVPNVVPPIELDIDGEQEASTDKIPILLRSSRLKNCTATDNAKTVNATVASEEKSVIPEGSPALLEDSDAEEAEYEEGVEALFSTSGRRYASELTCGAAVTLAEFVEFCRERAPKSFVDWGRKDITDDKADLPWGLTPHLRIAPSGSAKQSTSVVRRWTGVDRKLLSRCALIRADLLLDEWDCEAFAKACESGSAPLPPPLAFDPHSLHFLALSAARLAVRIITVAAWNARPALSDPQAADFARVVMPQDVEEAIRKLNSDGSLPEPTKLFLSRTNPRPDAIMPERRRPYSSKAYGSIQLCSKYPERVEHFPTDVNVELEEMINSLRKCAAEKVDISIGCRQRSDSESASKLLSCSDEELGTAVNEIKFPFPVYGLPENDKASGKGGDAQLNKLLRNLSETNSNASQDSDVQKLGGPNFILEHAPVDTSQLLDFLYNRREEKLSRYPSIVCFHRLAWLCLHALGIEPVDEKTALSAESIETDFASPNPVNRIRHARASSYGSLCNISAFGAAGVPGLLAVTMEAMEKLARAVENFVRLEADVLAACAAHDGGRPWIDRADVLLVCSVRKDDFPQNHSSPRS